MPSLDPQVMRRLVSAARVGRLVTVDADGRPNPVPFVFAVEGDVLVSAVDRKPKRSPDLRRLSNIRDRPDVAVLVDHYEEDWERVWWIRLRGRGRVFEDGPERDRALAMLTEKYPQYREDRPDGPAILIEVADWRGWSADTMTG
jgi:PPOX class probable F420-dependent enzyme